jgi:antitoxin PrlF
MATAMTVKGQVTIPKAVRDAAGIKPGDKVTAEALPDGRIVLSAAREDDATVAYRQQLEDMARRKPFRGFTTDELMHLTRGEV